MRKRIRQISIISTFLICASLLTIGCTPAKRPVPTRDYNQDRTRTQMYDNDNRTIPRENGYGLNGTNDMNNNTVPERYEDQGLGYGNMPNNMGNIGNNSMLEREVEKIAGVTDAVVIVNNDTAYVGIEQDGTNNMDTKTMQTEVVNRIKDRMPNISKVSVTTEMDRVDKLRGYTKDIISGKSVRDFVDQIEDLF